MFIGTGENILNPTPMYNKDATIKSLESKLQTQAALIEEIKKDVSEILGYCGNNGSANAMKRVSREILKKIEELEKES